MDNTIIIYTSPTCPRCKVLKKKMDNLNINYQETNDLTNIEDKGFLELPVLQIGQKYLSFKEAVEAISHEN